jgi:hypothetical protein
LKVIDYTNPSSKPIGGNFQNQNLNNLPVNKTMVNPKGPSQGISINNYQPELNKKNNPTPTGLLNRPNSQSKGPVK